MTIPDHDPKRKSRAAAIIIDGDKILLIRRIHAGRDYYIFPGGGVEAGETPDIAVLREIKEESNLNATLGPLLYVTDFIGDKITWHYRCTITEGVMNDVCDDHSQTDQAIFEWVDQAKLATIELLPTRAAEWLRNDIRTGFKDQPRHVTEYYSDEIK